MKSNNDLLLELQNISKKNNLDYFYNNLNLELKESKVTIALLGEFSSGKSTLANSFLGKRILPALDKPTTASIVEITTGDGLRAIAQTKNTFEEIDISELGEYIMGDKAKSIDKVLIEIKENDFIHNEFKIIDTPGISSINNIHDDITFGYLPFIDCALIVLNINQGGATNSLLEFLKEKILFKNQLSKLIFVLNHADTKSNEEIKNIIDNLKTQLKSIIPVPLVVAVSALDALNNKIEKSNITELKELINTNIIKDKTVLLEERKKKILNENTKLLVSLLTEKLNAFSIDNSELDKKIELEKEKINSLEGEKKRIKEPLEKFKNDIFSFLKSTSKNYSQKLLDLSMNNRDDEFENCVNNMTKEIKDFVNLKLKSLNLSLDNELLNLPDNIKSKIEDSVSSIRNTIDSISPIITGLLLAALTGPVGISAMEVTAESLLTAGGKSGLLARILPLVSEIAQKIDIPNHIMKFGAKKYLSEDIENQIYNALSSNISTIIMEVESEIENNINKNIINPQKELENILKKAYEDKKNNVSNILKMKEELENEISLLKEFL